MSGFEGLAAYFGGGTAAAEGGYAASATTIAAENAALAQAGATASSVVSAGQSAVTAQQIAAGVATAGKYALSAAQLAKGFAGYQSGAANSEAAKQEAQQAMAAAEQNAARQRRLVAYQQSTLRANAGAQGGTLEGSPMEVYLANAKEGELQTQDELYAGLIKKQSKRAAAANYRAGGAGDLFGGITSGIAALTK